MRQLTQNLGSGEMRVQDIPIPQVEDGMILVRNHFSIISAGTEGSTVKAARKSLVGKARQRPEQVKQVIDSLKKQGPLQTYRAVTNKLDAYSALGYSSSGEVIAVGDGVSEFIIGDKVACAGAGYANHAEVVSVPVKLCVKLENDANLRSAAYNTLGAISMQAVRQADMRLGETCAVIGLGLLGQLVSLILKASGVKVIGLDISEDSVKRARLNNVVDIGLPTDAAGVEGQVLAMTHGYGADSVIIAAGTPSLDPINLAGAIARKKGTVIVLGAVPTGFDRNPYWYEKELELKMACSYGPGRYDIAYEEKGIDYPLPYVRWTENRNMQAFQELIYSKKIDIEYLTTHEFLFENAKEAYDLVVSKSEAFAGIALRYSASQTEIKEKIKISGGLEYDAKISVSFIGAGNYAKAHLLPNIPKSKEVAKIGVLTRTGTTSKRVAEKYNFQFCTNNIGDLLSGETNLIFIATRHDSHGPLVMKCLSADKNVFVEKPLCLNQGELDEITSIQSKSRKSIMVGFNRRFSPLTRELKKSIGVGPMTMSYRINSGAIPRDSWIQDIQIGGGRIVGEVCHFIDYLTYLNGSLPIKVSANALPDPHNLHDAVNILLEFENGSTGVIGYYSNGSSVMQKEYIEVFCNGTSATLDDFKELKIYDGRKVRSRKIRCQDKGQEGMLKELFGNLLAQKPTPIRFEEIAAVTKATFQILTSIKNGGERVSI